MAPRNDNNKNVAQTEISNAVEKDEGYVPQQKMEVPLPAKHYDGVQNVPANVQMADSEDLQEQDDDYIEPKGHGNTFSQVFNAALEKANLEDSSQKSAKKNASAAAENAKESAEEVKEEVKKEVKKASEKLQDAAQKGMEGVSIMASAAYNSEIAHRAYEGAVSAAESVQEKLEEARKQAEKEQRAAKRSAAPIDNSPAGRARALLSSIFYFATLFVLATISFGRAAIHTVQEEFQKAREAGQEAKKEAKKGAQNVKREAKKEAEKAKSGLNQAIEMIRQVLMTIFLALQNGLIEGSKTLGYKAKSAEKKIEDGAEEAKEGVKQGAEEMKKSMKKASQKSH